jgi:predicted RNA-binding protein Jag
MSGFMKSALNLFGIRKEGSASPTNNMELEEFLREIAKRCGYELEFSKKETSEEGLTYEIKGAEAEEFLGSNSEMLEALAHLSMRFQRRKTGLANEPGASEGQEFRIRFDSGDFRDRKIQALRDLAASKRNKVLESNGKPSYINALGPAERKVIHTVITEFGDVVSESIGSGYFKRIRIRLKDDKRSETTRPNGRTRGGNQRRGGRGGNGGARGRGKNFNGGDRNYNRDQQPQFGNDEVNGNVISRTFEENEIDDNIGNRLAPGEEPVFSFNSSYDSDRE